MNGIASFCGQNVGGYRTIEYLPLAWVDRNSFDVYLNDSYEQIANVNIVTGDWLKAAVVADRRLFSETMQQGPHGVSFKGVVEGYVNYHSPALIQELNEMRGHEFLLRMTDGDGQQWLLGTLDHPFRFTFNVIGGERVTDFKHVLIRFESEYPQPIFGYNPQL